MIQRIQSVYLLIVGILTFWALFSPMAHFYEGFKFPIELSKMFAASNFKFMFSGLLVKLAGVFSLIAIFLFKNRNRQIKLIKTSNILIILWLIFAIYCFFTTPINPAYKNIGSYLSKYYTIFFPILMLLFNFLALKKIKVDEELVRSMNRLR